MKDFTLKSYTKYIQAIQKSYPNILRFDEFFSTDPRPGTFCLIRHDVDRRPNKALQMAQLENQMGIRATYYFRAKKHIFKPRIIQEISNLGHEVGYHYESLSDTKGHLPRALKDFEFHLGRFKKIVSVKTVSMHGRPLLPYDNRDLWRTPENHERLVEKYSIYGEVYLDIDYRDVAYLNDTGRNWTSDRSNIRDQTKYGIRLSFNSGAAALSYLNTNPDPKMVFQVHPERWAGNMIDYHFSLCFDTLANLAKYVVKKALMAKANACEDSSRRAGGIRKPP